jgi:tRNA(Met) cytidine acetyltransferase
MIRLNQFLLDLNIATRLSHDRQGVILCGSSEWGAQTVSSLLAANPSLRCFALGTQCLIDGELSYRSGQQLLGRECDLLVYDCHAGFDANSFNAALGTLIGGGLLVVMIDDLDQQHPDLGRRWLNRALAQWLVVKQQEPLPDINPLVSLSPVDDVYVQQRLAVERIVKVARGRSHRPLVITADRGRGKSSALGLAVAELFQHTAIDIVITAPTVKAIASVFDRVLELLDDVVQTATTLAYRGSVLRFIAPDDLVNHPPQCDLLIVDEASSIPLQMLCSMAQSIRRVIFSTTVHGYEGCGRGFSLKFIDWLLRQYPNGRTLALEHPIRWHANDSLEQWQYRTFLLNAELPRHDSCSTVADVVIQPVCKEQLVDSAVELRAIFALLVNAHYQTTPNDLFHLLSDPAVTITVAVDAGCYVGCLLSVTEGGLSHSLITEIQHGIRRPKGHLIPVTLANQLGFTQEATLTCQRIMRIAVHPQAQSRGIGSVMLRNAIDSSTCDYVASSFGATEALIHFWRKNHFLPIKIGSHRDQASGCYSVVMVSQLDSSWFCDACAYYGFYIKHALSNSLISMESGVIRALLSNVPHTLPEPFPYSLVGNYLLGGACFEAVSVWLVELVLWQCSIDSNAVSDLLIVKLLQQRSWSECSALFGLKGRKDIECQMRKGMAVLMVNLQCKRESSFT